MASDYFADLKKAPYPLYIAPKPYSFELNEDMIMLLRQEFNPEVIATKFTEAIKGKTSEQIRKAGQEIFEGYGQSWMKKTMQLGDEYPDRTIEMVLETVDREGKQFLFWPHVPQRYIEIAYLSTQQFLSLPIIANNQYELTYRVPKCFLFSQIKDKCGAEVANVMTCKNACLKALEALRRDLKLDVTISMPLSTAKDGHCEFSIKKN